MIETTKPSSGTFKLKKSKLQAEGYDVRALSDPVYVAHHKEGKFVRLTEEHLKDIEEGRLKL